MRFKTDVKIICGRCESEILCDTDSILEHSILKHNDQRAKSLLSQLHEIRRIANYAGSNIPKLCEEVIQTHVDRYFNNALLKQLKEKDSKNDYY